MKPLDMKLVNRLAPYKVEYKRGEYVFETDHDIRYSVWFEQDPVSTTMPAYWFNLTNRSQKASPNDSKIRTTVNYTKGSNCSAKTLSESPRTSFWKQIGTN